MKFSYYLRAVKTLRAHGISGVLKVRAEPKNTYQCGGEMARVQISAGYYAIHLLANCGFK